MFTKSLLFAATLALTAEAVKVKSKATSLIGVDIASLSKAELAQLRVQTANAFSDHKNKHGIHVLAQEENDALQDNYIAAEAQIQTMNSQSETCEFGHNSLSTMSQEQLNKLNGAKAPADQEVNPSLLLAQGNKYGFSIDMTTEEYQELYDEKWEEAQSKNWTCKKFDKKFTKKDTKYMSKQQNKKYKKQVERKQKLTENEFDAYWMRVMQDRTVAQSSIARCYDDNNDDNNDDDNNNDDNKNDDNNNDDDNNSGPQKCNADDDSFIWNDTVVTPIKNQGQCGSCYAFSAMTVLESALAIQTNKPVESYSEQQIVDCQSQYSNCQGCSGGWPVSMHESTRENPVTTNSAYPYLGTENSCNQNRVQSGNQVSADEVYYISKDIDSLKEALCTGPITLTVKASGPFMQYSGGVMTSADCPYNNDLDHAVSAIGWTVMDNQEVLVVRNSWGTRWGVDGYIYMAMDNGNDGLGPCGIFAYMSTATVNVTK